LARLFYWVTVWCYWHRPNGWQTESLTSV